MSGIAGYWNLQKRNGRSIDPNSILPMIEAIAHRGPDGLHSFKTMELTFTHAHLHSSPQSEYETLPLKDPNSSCVITADARLDDRDELIHRLNIKRRPCDQIGDGFLILQSYLKWGAYCPKHLKGDFAFTIWNPQTQTLFAARDHFGVKPFAYFSNEKIFAFASQAHAVQACKEVPSDLNQARIADCLIPWLEGIDHSSSAFSQIHRLPPAHSLTVSRSGKSLQSYWKLEAPSPLRLSCDAEYEEAFQKIFTCAVSRRLDHGNKVAAMLSGGMDSSSIVAVGRKICKKSGGSPLQVFSATLPPDKAENSIEAQCIRSVIAQGNCQAHTIHPECYAKTAPTYQHSATHCSTAFEFMPLSMAVFQNASQNGVKSLLTGIDGDLCASAPSRLILYLIRSGRLITALKESFHSGYRFDDFHYALWTAIDCFLPAVLPQSIWSKIRKRKKQSQLHELIVDSAIRPDFAQQVHLYQRLSTLFELELPEKELPNITQRQAHMLTAPFVSVALERYDSIAAQCGLDCRHPFLDLDLVNFCLSLPWQQKTRKGWNKWILRKSIGKLLPPEVQWRTDDSNLSADFALAGRANNPLTLKAEAMSQLTNTLHPFLTPESIPNDPQDLNEHQTFLATWLQNQKI